MTTAILTRRPAHPRDFLPDPANADRFSDTLHRCELKIVRLYRLRARYALARARLERKDGNILAMRGFVDQAKTWHRFAGEWARRARQNRNPVLSTNREVLT